MFLLKNFLLVLTPVTTVRTVKKMRISERLESSTLNPLFHVNAHEALNIIFSTYRAVLEKILFLHYKSYFNFHPILKITHHTNLTFYIGMRTRKPPFLGGAGRPAIPAYIK